MIAVRPVQQRSSRVPTVQQLIVDNIQLLSLPEVCLQVQDMADDPLCAIADLGQVVSHDPALTAVLLKLVNSAYYGFPSRVETASRAISLIGIQALRSLVLSVSVAEVFSRVPPEQMDMVSFWRHSVFCGLVARRLARRCGVLHDERLFIAGLLHDMGRILLLTQLPDQACAVLQGYESMPVCEAERAVLGFDHAELGAALMRLWQLSEGQCDAVACHHAPDRAVMAPCEAAIVHIANAVTNGLEQEDIDAEVTHYDPYAKFLNASAPSRSAVGASRGAEHGTWEALARAQIDPQAWSMTGVSPEVLPAVVSEATEAFDAVLDVIYPIPYPV